MMKQKKFPILLLVFLLVAALSACGNNNEGNAGGANGNNAAGNDLGGNIAMDGSSTVYPIALTAAEEFMNVHGGVNVTVGESGTSNGISKLVNGEIQIADASRKIKEEELQAIRDKGDDALEFAIAFDGITVAVNKENDWAKEMTVAELKMVWDKDSKVSKWSDIRPDWPKERINLYGPGTASGTFEFFTEAIVGEKNVSRSDYTASEDDNVLVKGVTGDKYGMAYFGFSYYNANKDQLNAVALQEAEGGAAVAPSQDTIRDGSYKPLSRPLYLYVSKSALAEPQVKEFMRYVNGEEGRGLVEESGYVRLPDETYEKNLQTVQ